MGILSLTWEHLYVLNILLSVASMQRRPVRGILVTFIKLRKRLIWHEYAAKAKGAAYS